MALPKRSGDQVHRFLSHFSGPIIWALEIAVVLLIIVNHTIDFVDAVIMANLVIIVLMMVFKAGLGLWKDRSDRNTNVREVLGEIDARYRN